MKELWEDIPSYEGFYQASNMGRVRSIDRVVPIQRGATKRSIKGYVLKPYLRKGYLVVDLHSGSRESRKATSAHTIIWRTFNGQVPHPLQIDHKNEDKTDNRLSNLQLLSNRDNCIKGRLKYRDLPTGAYWREDTHKYYSRIQINGKDKYLGMFNCPTAAHLAYEKERLKLAL